MSEISKEEVNILFAFFYIEELIDKGLMSGPKRLTKKSLELIRYYELEGMKPSSEVIAKTAMALIQGINNEGKS